MLFVIFFLMVNSSSAVRNGDEAFIGQRYAEAISMYEAGLSSSQNSSELLWRIARCYITMGDVAKREDRESFYRKADSFARRAVDEDTLNSDAYCWRAVAIGYVAIYEGTRAKVAAANDIKRDLDRALELNPNNDIAYSILGTFYRTLGKVGWLEKQLAELLLGGIPEGGFADGERALLKAVELAPSIIRHRFELGMLYMDMDRPEDAGRVFAEALKYPPVLASDKHRIERMKKHLQK